MKPNFNFPPSRVTRFFLVFWLIIFSLIFVVKSHAQVCSDPANVMYGLDSVGNIYPVTVSSGAVAAKINPAYAAPFPEHSNAMGYSTLNGNFYYFKRNVDSPSVQFVSFNPATNVVTVLASPATPSPDVINLGCMAADGLRYYCIDIRGALYMYRVATNTWVLISATIRDQFGSTFFTKINGMTNMYGDLAIDGAGNMWAILSGNNRYGVYRIANPLPIAAVAVVNAEEILPMTTVTPGGVGFGGIAFNSTGQIILSTNHPDNKLYRLNNNLSLTFLSNLSTAGVGNDLTSCNFPLSLLPKSVVNFSVDIKNENSALLTWNDLSTTNKNYIIEHSVDQAKWDAVGSIPKSNFNTDQTYSFTFENALAGRHFYRLRLETLNGTVSYSDTKTIVINSKSNFSIWRDPNNDMLKIESKETDNNKVTKAIIYSQSGIKVKEVSLKGSSNSVDISPLKPGIYYVVIQGSMQQQGNLKFIKI